MLTVKERRHV